MFFFWPGPTLSVVGWLMCVFASLAVWIVVAWSTTCLIGPLLPPPVLLLLSSRQLTLVASAAPTRWPRLCSPLLNPSTALASLKCPGDQIKQTIKTSLQLVQSHVNRTSLAASATVVITIMVFLVNCYSYVRCFVCLLVVLLQVLYWAWSHWAVNRARGGLMTSAKGKCQQKPCNNHSLNHDGWIWLENYPSWWLSLLFFIMQVMTPSSGSRKRKGKL
jgi:hypothetical protein